MIKYLQLQQHFDAEKIKAEMAQMEESRWKQHYNKSHYEGQWNVLPLRSLNGSAENIVSVHATTNPYSATPLLQAFPSIQSVLRFFACEKRAVRLMKLHAGAIIKEHCDQEMSFEEGEVRFHIPVTTNPGVAFYLEEEQVVMQEGECWYLNLSLKHRVKNAGTTDRVHLVIDCKVNEWVRNLFAQQARVQKQAEEKQHHHDPETTKKIIAELRKQNTPTSLELAANLENSLS